MGIIGRYSVSVFGLSPQDSLDIIPHAIRVVKRFLHIFDNFFKNFFMSISGE